MSVVVVPFAPIRNNPRICSRAPRREKPSRRGTAIGGGYRSPCDVRRTFFLSMLQQRWNPLSSSFLLR